MTDHDVAPTLRLQPESRRPGATWANRHIFGDMDAITALRAMSSARNINIHVNNDWAYADWGSSPSARRYWARRGAAECDWPGLWGLLEAYVYVCGRIYGF